MNKEFLLQIMVNSFKKENIKLAVENGLSQSESEKYVEGMSDIILKCMVPVLDDLLENIPNFVK